MTKQKTRAKRPASKPLRPSEDEAVFLVLHNLVGLSSTEVSKLAYAAAKANPQIFASISPATIRKWRRGPKHGGTRYPTHILLKTAAAIAGYELKLVKKK